MSIAPIARLTLLLGLLGFALGASAAPDPVPAEGLIRHQSPYSVAQTVKRFTTIAEQKGLRIFATVDHRAGASRVDMTLRPTTVVIFGNPKGGTPFMQCAQTIGIDLPLKALVWKDADSQTWFGYNDPAYIAARHGAAECKAVKPISKALAGLTRATVSEKKEN